MPDMDEQTSGDARDSSVHIENEPTISYIPPEAVHTAADAADLVKGAFRYALVVDRGRRAGTAFVLAPGTTTVGRDSDSGIFLDDVTVSRYHCQFVLDGDTLVVEDVGSTNGTYVNRERRDRAELATGDEVLIGKFHLVVARGDA